MKLIKLTFLFFFFYSELITSQNIKGDFLNLPYQTIRLEGFNGLNTYPISSTTTDEKGRFTLNYSKSDYGVGYLISSEVNKSLFLILSGENIVIQGEVLGFPETINNNGGQENIYFKKYANEHPRREQSITAWGYLEKIYTSDSLFSIQKSTLKAIQDEKNRIKNEDIAFLETLPNDSYVKWFLPTRKLVSSVSTVVQYRPEEITETIEAFRRLDYTDQRLYKSGLFKDAIDNHFWLIENI
jgi:hypothetical protein